MYQVIFSKKTGHCISYQYYLLSESNTLPDFYITSPSAQNELSPTTQKDVIPPERCSNYTKFEQELATYKGQCFPFMLAVKKI